MLAPPFLHALIHLSAWKVNSANCVLTEFSEVRPKGWLPGPFVGMCPIARLLVLDGFSGTFGERKKDEAGVLWLSPGLEAHGRASRPRPSYSPVRAITVAFPIGRPASNRAVLNVWFSA